MAIGYTLFCDDIRHEMGGKISYIGVYKQKMIVHSEFPAALPRFVMSVTYQEEASLRPDKVEVMIFLPGDPDDKPSIQGEISFSDAEKNDAIVRLPEDRPDKLVRAEAEIVLSPLLLSQPGDIKVRFRDRDKIIKAGSLIIERDPALPNPPAQTG